MTQWSLLGYTLGATLKICHLKKRVGMHNYGPKNGIQIFYGSCINKIVEQNVHVLAHA